MDHILEYITNADDGELTQLLKAIIARHGLLHPDWELTMLSLPKSNSAEREQRIDQISAMLKQETFQA